MVTTITDLDELLTEPAQDDFLVVRDTGEVFDKKVKKSVLLQSINDTLDALGTAATEDIQVSPTDATVGRILLNGAHGLGGNTPIYSSDLNSISVTGWRYADGSATNKPSASNGWVQTEVNTSNSKTQLFVTEQSTPEFYFRSRVSGVWGSWEKVATDNTALNEANNLSDLDNVATARTNLDVYSKGESDERYLNESSNLLDVVDPSAAFDNIKQGGTEGFSGTLAVSSLAAALAGTDENTAMAPDLVHEAFNQYGLGLRHNAIATFSTKADYSKPAGWRGFVSADAANGNPGAPDSPLFYYHVLAKRDFNDGYTAIAITRTSPRRYYFTVNDGNTNFPVWNEIYTELLNATLTEAREGAVNDKVMTPLRTHEAFNRLGYFGSDKTADLLANNGGDANNVNLVNGRYIAQSGPDLNLPADATNGTLEHVLINSGDAGYGHQLYTNYLNAKYFFRNFSNGSFGSWNEIYNTGNNASQSEAEAGTVNNKPSTPLRVKQYVDQFGLGSLNDLVTGDWNDIDKTGFYMGNNLINSPIAEWVYVIHQEHGSTGYAFQTAFNLTNASNDPQVYYRRKVSGVWDSSWTTDFNTANVASQSEAETGTVNDKPMSPLRTHQAFNQYGLGDNSLQALSVDANTLNTTGFYYLSSSGSSNLPISENGYLLVHASSATNYTYQRYIGNSSVNGSSYERRNIGGSWTAWNKIYSENGNASQSDAEAGTVNDKPMTPLRTHQALKEFGIGYADQLDRGSDLNTLLGRSGELVFVATGVGATNTPNNSSGTVWTPLRNGAVNEQVQMFFQQAANRAYIRSGNDNSWDDWSEFYHTGNTASQAEASYGSTNDKPMTPVRTKESIGSSMGSLMNIGNYRYSGRSASIPLSGGDSTVWSHDGTRLFALDTFSTNDTVYQLNASRPFDSTSLTNSGNSLVVADDSVAIEINDDSSRLYILGSGTDSVVEWNLSTPGELTGATQGNSFSVATQTGSPLDLKFSRDGTKMFVSSDVDTAIYQYSLGTAWEVNSASPDGTFSTFPPDTRAINIRKFAFSPDGRNLYIYDDGQNIIDQIYLERSWNVLDTSYAYNTTDVIIGLVNKLEFSPDGNTLYLVESNAIREYDLSLSVTTKVELSNEFDSSGIVQVSRTGNTVTVTGLADMQSLVATTTASSVAGALPAWARPRETVSNVYEMLSSGIAKIIVYDTGLVELQHRDWTGGLFGISNWYTPTISYAV